MITKSVFVTVTGMPSSSYSRDTLLNSSLEFAYGQFNRDVFFILRVQLINSQLSLMNYECSDSSPLMPWLSLMPAISSNIFISFRSSRSCSFRPSIIITSSSPLTSLMTLSFFTIEFSFGFKSCSYFCSLYSSSICFELFSFRVFLGLFFLTDLIPLADPTGSQSAKALVIPSKSSY